MLPLIYALIAFLSCHLTGHLQTSNHLESESKQNSSTKTHSPSNVLGKQYVKKTTQNPIVRSA